MMVIWIYALGMLVGVAPTSFSPAAICIWLVLHLPVIWAMANLARVLGKTPFFFAVAAIVPIVNLLETFDLLQNASRRLKDAGIKQGFVGTRVPEHPPIEIT
jgi:hypothetical protein